MRPKIKIISNFHDYYDCIKAYDQEQEPLYLRKTQEIKEYEFKYSSRDIPWLICLGDNYYPFKKMMYYIDDKTKKRLIERDTVSSYCYNIEQCDKFVEEHYNKKDKDLYYKKEKQLYKYYRWLSYRSYIDNRYELNTFFNSDYSIYLSFLDKYKVPIICFEDFTINSISNHFILNPRLLDYSFYRIKDPQSVYQEIRMWLSNQAAPEKPIPELSNKDKIVSKGFDGSSFRNTK